MGPPQPTPAPSRPRISSIMCLYHVHASIILAAHLRCPSAPVHCPNCPQVVDHLPGSDVSLDSAYPVLPREAPNAYRAAQPFVGITVTGNVSQTFALVATARAPALPVPLTVVFNVTIQPCALLEVRACDL